MMYQRQNSNYTVDPSGMVQLTQPPVDYAAMRAAKLKQAQEEANRASVSYGRTAEILPGEQEAFRASATSRGLGGSRIASLQSRQLLASRLGIPLERLTQQERAGIMSRIAPGQTSVQIRGTSRFAPVYGDRAQFNIAEDPTSERLYFDDEEITQSSPYFQYLSRFSQPHRDVFPRLVAR